MQNKAVFVGNNIGLYAKICVITVGQRILEDNAQQKKKKCIPKFHQVSERMGETFCLPALVLMIKLNYKVVHCYRMKGKKRSFGIQTFTKALIGLLKQC